MLNLRERKLLKIMYRIIEIGYQEMAIILDIYKEEYLFMQSIINESEVLKGIFNFQSNFREACAVIKTAIILLVWKVVLHTLLQL